MCCVCPLTNKGITTGRTVVSIGYALKKVRITSDATGVRARLSCAFPGALRLEFDGPGATRRLERNMQTRPSRNGRGHFFLCTWNAKKSSARGEPKKLPLDTATCAHDAWVTCNILRNNVLKRFSFRRVNWNWEWKCLWADGRGGRIASGSDPDLALRRANAATAAPCRNNCHKPSRSPCGHTQHKSGDPAQRKRTRFRVLFRGYSPGANKRNKLTTCPIPRQTPWPSGRRQMLDRGGRCRGATGCWVQE